MKKKRRRLIDEVGYNPVVQLRKEKVKENCFHLVQNPLPKTELET